MSFERIVPGMQCVLTRDQRTPIDTMGSLAVDGEHFCWTLEPPSRSFGRPRPTSPVCILPGFYTLIRYPSPRFGYVVPRVMRLLPDGRLLDPAGESFIEVHKGNTVIDTLGCILLGLVRLPHALGEGSSKPAFDAFMERFLATLLRGAHVSLEIREPDRLECAA